MEPPFGTTKRVMDVRQILTRGKTNEAAEVVLIFFILQFKTLAKNNDAKSNNKRCIPKIKSSMIADTVLFLISMRYFS